MSSGGSSDNNKFNNKFGYEPPVKSAFAQAKVSVCHVQAPPIPPDTAGLQGSAALYELVEEVFTVATNNRVIPVTDTDFLVRIVFKFEGVEATSLSRDEIKFCTTNEELDATVIELSEQCVKRLQQLGAKFIRLTTARESDKIAMAQYPEGEVSFDKGDLIRRGTTSLLAIAVFHLASRQKSLEKRICELEKGKKSNSSQRKAPNADKEEITTEMYTNYSSVFSVLVVLYNLLHKLKTN